MFLFTNLYHPHVIDSPAPKASSPAHSQKGAPEGSTSMTPSGDKHERDEAGTPGSSAAPGTHKQGSTAQRPWWAKYTFYFHPYATFYSNFHPLEVLITSQRSPVVTFDMIFTAGCTSIYESHMLHRKHVYDVMKKVGLLTSFSSPLQIRYKI